MLFVELFCMGGIFEANSRMKSGVDGKPGGIGIGSKNDSIGLYRNGCAVSNGI